MYELTLRETVHAAAVNYSSAASHYLKLEDHFAHGLEGVRFLGSS
jgi:hypothetical protein